MFSYNKKNKLDRVGLQTIQSLSDARVLAPVIIIHSVSFCRYVLPNIVMFVGELFTQAGFLDTEHIHYMYLRFFQKGIRSRFEFIHMLVEVSSHLLIRLKYVALFIFACSLYRCNFGLTWLFQLFGSFKECKNASVVDERMFVIIVAVGCCMLYNGFYHLRVCVLLSLYRYNFCISWFFQLFGPFKCSFSYWWTHFRYNFSCGLLYVPTMVSTILFCMVKLLLFSCSFECGHYSIQLRLPWVVAHLVFNKGLLTLPLMVGYDFSCYSCVPKMIFLDLFFQIG